VAKATYLIAGEMHHAVIAVALTENDVEAASAEVLQDVSFCKAKRRMILQVDSLHVI